MGSTGYLVLLYKTADARHLRNAGNAFQTEFDDIVLNAAQFGKIMSARFIDDGIGKSPAQAGGIGTEDGIDIGGNFVLHGLEIFQDTASGPVDIRPFFKNDVDEGTA